MSNVSYYADRVVSDPTIPAITHSLVPLFVSAALVILFLVLVCFYCKCKPNNINPPPPMELELQAREIPQASPPGVSPKVRIRISQITYSEDFEIPHGAKTCALCLYDFKHGQQISIFPRCSHVLHTQCMETYLNHSETFCLYCREAISIPTPVEGIGTSTAAAAADGEDTAGSGPTLFPTTS